MGETRPEQEYVERQDTERQDPDLPDTFPSGETVRADRRDAEAGHQPDRRPTPEEEEAAPDQVEPDVAEAYREAAERGARQQGEGRLP